VEYAGAAIASAARNVNFVISLFETISDVIVCRNVQS